MAQSSPTYKNIKKMINELGIESLSWFNVCLDNKAKRESLGMQPCSAKYSCCYCFGCAPFDNPEQMELRTFGSIKKNAADFLALVEKIGFEDAKKRASDFFSVTNYPILIQLRRVRAVPLLPCRLSLEKGVCEYSYLKVSFGRNSTNMGLK